MNIEKEISIPIHPSLQRTHQISLEDFMLNNQEFLFETRCKFGEPKHEKAKEKEKS